MEFFYKIKNIFLDILFPPICLNCEIDLQKNEIENKICNECLKSIVINSSFFCPKCKARFAENKKICHLESKYLLASATSYNNKAIKNIIHFLKYKKWKSLENIIKPIIEKYLEDINYNFEDFIIVPIPLHPDRQKERGFNQSEIIGQIICNKLNLRLENKIIQRIRYTEPQAKSKTSEERKNNIKNCFALVNSKKVKNKNIILIDDIHTTGLTINEASKTLKNAGVKKIIAFVLAKT
ncbi:ComF family protein [Patescibacteria group bacterium]|nr:ComF family protein [Patescibacteria group bacterium]